MRFVVFGFAGLALLAACERSDSDVAVPTPDPVDLVGVPASDELPLDASATGISFWSHPNIAFNSLMIVASETSVASYNIEDGNEVSKIPDVAADGAAVSYFGFGPTATGVLTYFDTDAAAFSFHTIDNNSRLFTPLDGGPEIRGAIRGFCFGRANTANDPTLFVVQKGKVLVFNLALIDSDAGAWTISVSSQAELETPDTISACAVDADGVLITATDKGVVYRLAGEDSFAAPFANAAISSMGGLAIIETVSPVDGEPKRYGQIVALDRDNAAAYLFDREDGHTLGAVTIAGTDEISAVETASVIGVAGQNLGGLYRDGLIALGLEGETAAIKLIPMSGAYNALSQPIAALVDPRGVQPANEDDGLIIDIELPPIE